MIPMYRYMDSQPFEKNRMPVNPYQYPNMGSVPSYTMMDPAKSCMPPHDSGHNCCHYGYPMPPSCCNDGNFFPGYYNFRPPHLPVPPHQHMHCYGSYPPCPEPYYVQYVPPMHYNVEQPRYEFDKNMMRNHHCCGCPNSLCGQKQKEDRCVKIEEEKPDDQRKGSMVPFQLGNNQSPIVWIPPDYVGSEKGKEPSETGAMKQEKERHGLNSPKNLDPKFWHGWPLSDLSRLGSWFPDAEGMGTRSVQNNQPEDGKKEFPFPLIWMPTFGREERAGKDVQNMDAPTKYTEEPSNVGKLVPTNILQRNDATSEGPEVVKTINQSNIPEMDVKHKTDDANKKKERRCIVVEPAKENEVRESSKDNVKGQKSTSPKKSRLPPVCLRVDPLPKKKNGNGSSRSQSPSKLTDVKENTQLDSKINSAIAEPNSEKIIKEVEVKTHDSLDGNHGNKENISRNGEPLSLTAQSQEKVLDKLCKEGTEEQGEKDRTIDQAPTGKNVDEGSEVNSGDIVQEEGKNEKPNLSDDEAAMLIQSAYRGYEVRKGELLKKMRQLAEVRQQVMEVHNRVNALELAPPQDERERVFVGEMIMGLLLKLDTIQGLYPSVREFRKSLAKELVALQEKLDCMVINKPTEVVQEATVEKHAEHFDTATYHEIKEEEQHKEHQKPTGDGNSELPEVNDENTKVHEAEQLVEVKESEVQNEDTSELSSHDLSKNFEGEEAESKVEMEQNVELLTDAEQKVGDVLQADRQKEAVNQQAYSFGDTRPAEDSLQVDASRSVCDDQVGAQTGLTPQVLDKINISAPAENGQTEDQLAADVELPMREDTNPNNFEAAKLEQLEIRGEVSETEENAHDLEVELSSDGISNVKHPEVEDCHVSSVGSEQNREHLGYTEHENENEGAPDESAELPGEELNSNDNDPNIQNKLITEQNKQLSMDELVPSSQLDNQARRACDESADLLEELSKSYHDQNVPNEIVNEENEQRTADEETKTAEDMLHEPLVLDPGLSSKLDNEANELHAADEATLDGPSIQMGEGSLPSSPNPNKLDLGTEKETDKKLVEENEKMREMVEKLMEAGKEQLAIISKLSGRVKDLEKRLARKKKQETDKKLVEENEKMREMVEKLMEAGKEQLTIISKLSGRVKDLEKRLARKKKQRRGCGLPMPRQHTLNGRIKA